MPYLEVRKKCLKEWMKLVDFVRPITKNRTFNNNIIWSVLLWYIWIWNYFKFECVDEIHEELLYEETGVKILDVMKRWGALNLNKKKQ